MPQRSYGWKPAPPDHPLLLTAPKYSPPLRLSANLPASVDLRPKMPPVYDQGQLGSCADNATSGVVQYDAMLQGLSDQNTPSRLFAYYNARAIEGTVSQDSGSSMADAVKALADYGWCDERIWPYDISRFTDKPPQLCYDAAAPNKITDYASVPQDATSLKSALASGEPVIFGFVVYQSFESDAVAQSGVVPMPGIRDRLQGAIGGHGVVMVGYDDAQQVWIVRNSWGNSWGQRGYCLFPYRYILDSTLASDMWIIRSLPGSKPQPPQPTPTPPSPGPAPAFAQTMRVYDATGKEEAYYGLTRLA